MTSEIDSKVKLQDEILTDNVACVWSVPIMPLVCCRKLVAPA